MGFNAKVNENGGFEFYSKTAAFVRPKRDRQ